MDKIMGKYETIIVADVKLGEEGIEALTKKFTDLIAANGTVESVDVWGKKTLAYEIDYNKEGHYTLVNFEAPTDFITELERVYRITEGILRSMVVRKGE